MQPRRSARNSRKGEETESEHPRTRSAARDVYHSPELMAGILELLPRRDLAVMMRLCRKGMWAVAKVLYRTMSQEDTFLYMGRETRMYCDAVVHRNTEDPNFSPSMCAVIDRTFRREGRERPLDPQNLDHLAPFFIPPLRKHFPRLRSVNAYLTQYGSLRTSTMYWFDPSQASQTISIERPPRPDPETFGAYHIERFRPLTYSLSDPPPRTIPTDPSFSGDYPLVADRFDLRLDEPDPRPQHLPPAPSYTKEWLTSLREDARYGDLAESLSVGTVPLTLDDIISLYELQQERGNQRRLSYVHALHSPPCDLPTFQRFASVAGSSIRSLFLSARNATDEQPTILSFPDLPHFFSIIRRDLPNLESLSIGVKDIESAEAFCKELIEEDCLTRRGSLNMPWLVAAVQPVPVFNIARLLAPYLTESASLIVGPNNNDAERVMKLLRRQPSEHLRTLAKVDFPALDYHAPNDITRLSFQEDGRLKRRGESMAAELSKDARRLRKRLMEDIMSILDEASKAVVDQAEQLEASSATATEGEMLAESGRMLEALQGLERTAASQVRNLVMLEVEKITYYRRSLQQREI